MLHLKECLRVLFRPLAFELKTLNRVAEIGPNIINIFFYAVFKINVKACKSFIELSSHPRSSSPHTHFLWGEKKTNLCRPWERVSYLVPASRNIIVFQGTCFMRFLGLKSQLNLSIRLSLTCISKCRKAETKNKLSTQRTPSNQLQSSLLRSFLSSRHLTLLPLLRDEPKTAAWKTA